MTGANYADDLALLENIHAQAKSMQHILKQAARGTYISVYDF